MVLPVQPGLGRHIEAWQRWLTAEKRLAANTVESYTLDLHAFLKFLAGHWGYAPGTDDLAGVSSQDLRAFQAHRRRRAAEKDKTIAKTSQARGQSALKNFFRYLQREGVLENAAVMAMETPRLPKPVPKALNLEEALDTLEATEDLSYDPWVCKRDRALFTLLYGAGLRIGEALALNQRDLSEGERLIVTGKGGKQRVVPLLAAIRDGNRRLCFHVSFQSGPGRSVICRQAGQAFKPRCRAKTYARCTRIIRVREDGDASRAPSQLRHTFVRRRRGFTHHSRAYGPCLFVDHATLYKSRRRIPHRALRHHPSTSEAETFLEPHVAAHFTTEPQRIPRKTQNPRRPGLDPGPRQPWCQRRLFGSRVSASLHPGRRFALLNRQPSKTGDMHPFQKVRVP